MLLIGKGLDSIFNKPESIFVKTTPKELFFEGVRFECTVTDFAGSAICSSLQEREHIFVKEAELIYRYGYLATVL